MTMSIYLKSKIEAGARQAAAAFVKGKDARCPFTGGPYPDWHEAAMVWRDAFAAEVDRLREEVAA